MPQKLPKWPLRFPDKCSKAGIVKTQMFISNKSHHLHFTSKSKIKETNINKSAFDHAAMFS